MNSPKLAIGDGAMGFWSAMDECYPETKHQRCWVHKTANVLNCLPKNLQGKAKQDLHDIYGKPTHETTPHVHLISLLILMRLSILKRVTAYKKTAQNY